MEYRTWVSLHITRGMTSRCWSRRNTAQLAVHMHRVVEDSNMTNAFCIVNFTDNYYFPHIEYHYTAK